MRIGRSTERLLGGIWLVGACGGNPERDSYATAAAIRGPSLYNTVQLALTCDDVPCPGLLPVTGFIPNDRAVGILTSATAADALEEQYLSNATRVTGILVEFKTFPSDRLLMVNYGYKLPLPFVRHPLAPARGSLDLRQGQVDLAVLPLSRLPISQAPELAEILEDVSLSKRDPNADLVPGTFYVEQLFYWTDRLQHSADDPLAMFDKNGAWRRSTVMSGTSDTELFAYSLRSQNLAPTPSDGGEPYAVISGRSGAPLYRVDVGISFDARKGCIANANELFAVAGQSFGYSVADVREMSAKAPKTPDGLARYANGYRFPQLVVWGVEFVREHTEVTKGALFLERFTRVDRFAAGGSVYEWVYERAETSNRN